MDQSHDIQTPFWPDHLLKLVLLAAGGFLFATHAGAASILVNTVDDEDFSDGDCSLREAVYAANNNVPRDNCNAGNTGLDTITILVHGTITLSSELLITEALSVQGLGTDATTISGDDQTRHFVIDMPDDTHDFTILNMTLEEGSSDQSTAGGPVRGGGSLRVLQVGTLQVDSIRFRDNIASGTDADVRGGAILTIVPGTNTSRVEIRDSTFENNVSLLNGGAVAVVPDGVMPGVTSLIVERTRFFLNAAGSGGGAIAATVGSFSIVDSVFDTSFTSSGFCCALGGAASLSSGAGSLNVIERTTFTGSDSRDEGGALFLNRGLTLIRNSTFHENRSRAGGGQAIELRESASAFLFFTTLLDNGRGVAADEAIRVCADCALGLTHSIVWSRWGPDIDCRTLGGSVASSGFNIDGSGTCTSEPTDLPMTDPQLLPLDDYGDAVIGLVLPTMLPHPDSPAIEGGDSVCPGPLGGITSEDQRGVSRPAAGPLRGGAICDIGAVEYSNLMEPEVFDLAVSAGTGGRVLSDPAGVDCPGNCSMGAAEGFVIALTAQADPGFEFVEWSGACSGSDRRDCDVTMNGPRNVTATFQPEGEPLSIGLDGNGVGSVFSSPAGIACPGDCEERFPLGTIVTLTPAPASGSEFLNWAGDCTGSSCQITLDAPRQAIAIFGNGDLLFLDGFE